MPTAVEAILKSVALPLQLGGGIRDTRTIERWLAKGVARVIIGTAAVRDPGFVRAAAAAYPGRVAVGIDAKAEGWRSRAGPKVSDMSALDLGKRFEDAGIAAIIYTDIARDGMLEGLNIEATLALADALNDPGDRLGRSWRRSTTCAACSNPIVPASPGPSPGRALYDGRLDTAEALRLIRAGRECSLA